MVLVEQSRRTFPRVDLGISVPYRVNALGCDWEEGEVLNLSAGGVLLRGPRPGDVVLAHLLSERVRVSVTLSLDARVMHATTRVAWSEDEPGRSTCRLGLRFLDLSTADQEFVWQWVRGRLNQGAQHA